jgi:hypothetical protein
MKVPAWLLVQYMNDCAEADRILPQSHLLALSLQRPRKVTIINLDTKPQKQAEFGFLLAGEKLVGQ